MSHQTDSFRAPRAVFGLPAYNHAHKLREALESLLDQTETNFRLMVSDDQSTDDTLQIIQEYAAKDNRIVYRRNETRLGYIGNARRCFELAREFYPTAEFFAWASDHDVWHPSWLEVLAGALDQHPDAVIAYPLARRMDAEGVVISLQTEQFSTVGEALSARRFIKTFNKMSAGNMIYGLIRARALEHAGVLPWHLLPDRLTLMKLSFYGTAVGVPTYLWDRRYSGLASIDRQIRASFFNRPGTYLRVPWWVAHSAHLFRTFTLEPETGAPISRLAGAGYSLLYLALGIRYRLRKRLGKAKQQVSYWVKYAPKEMARKRKRTVRLMRQRIKRLLLG